MAYYGVTFYLPFYMAYSESFSSVVQFDGNIGFIDENTMEVLYNDDEYDSRNGMIYEAHLWLSVDYYSDCVDMRMSLSFSRRRYWERSMEFVGNDYSLNRKGYYYNCTLSYDEFKRAMANDSLLRYFRDKKPCSHDGCEETKSMTKAEFKELCERTRIENEKYKKQELDRLNGRY